MKLLIDTHVFLWLRNSPDKVPKDVLQLYQNSNNVVFLSMASIWEMQIKNQLGKLDLDLPLGELVEQQCLENELKILNIEAEHIYALQNLPFHHSDPFDRLILSQAQIENLTLASADRIFHQYDVNLIWK